MHKAIFSAVVLMLLFGSTGCALLPLSAVGTVVGLGNSSVTEGRDNYFWGKLHCAEAVRFDTARAAVKATAADLGLKAKWPEKLTNKRSEMAFIDDEGTQIGIRIERRTDRLVRFRVDVGYFGSEMTDRLFLLRLRAHLPDPTSRPAS